MDAREMALEKSHQPETGIRQWQLSTVVESGAACSDYDSQHGDSFPWGMRTLCLQQAGCHSQPVRLPRVPA